MKWTIGICTTQGQETRVLDICRSICSQTHDFSDIETIIIGGKKPEFDMPHLKWMSFDEKLNPDKITIKKNRIVKEAKHPNVLLLHDYIKLGNNYFKNFETFGEEWDVCTNRILDINGERFRDHMLFLGLELPLNNGNWNHRSIQWLDYNITNQTHRQYVSGSAYAIKKEFALKYPLDESKGWGMSEDMDFSLRCRGFWRLKCNYLSTLHFLKQKECFPPRCSTWGYKQNGGIDGLV